MTNPKARLVFCTHPSLYSDIVLNKLIAAEHIEIVGLVHSTRVLRKRGWSAWDNILFLRKVGLRYSLYLLLVTHGYLWLRKQAPLIQPSCSIISTRNINDAAIVSQLQALQPDYIVCAHFNQLLEESILELPKLGCINLHPGKLPRYKGVDPAFYALYHQEKEATVSIHYQDQQFDTGSLITEKPIPITPRDSLLSLNTKLFTQGAELLSKLLHTSKPAILPHQPQATEDYDSWPTPQITRRFFLKSRRLFDLQSFLQAL